MFSLSDFYYVFGHSVSTHSQRTLTTLVRGRGTLVLEDSKYPIALAASQFSRLRMTTNGLDALRRCYVARVDNLYVLWRKGQRLVWYSSLRAELFYGDSQIVWRRIAHGQSIMDWATYGFVWLLNLIDLGRNSIWMIPIWHLRQNCAQHDHWEAAVSNYATMRVI